MSDEYELIRALNQEIETFKNDIDKRLEHLELIIDSVGETINIALDDGFLHFLGISKSDAAQMVMDKGTWFSRIVKLEQKMVSLRPVAMELRNDGKFITDYVKRNHKFEKMFDWIKDEFERSQKMRKDQKRVNQVFLDYMQKKEKRWWKFWQR